MGLVLFAVGGYGGGDCDDAKDGEHGEVEPKVGKATAFEAYATHNVDEIARWENVGEILRPRYH